MVRVRRRRRNFRTLFVSWKSRLPLWPTPLWLINSLLVTKRQIDKMLRPKIDLKSTRIFSPKPFSFESLRSGKVTTATEGLLKSEFAIIPTYSTADSLCQMKTNFPAKLNSYEPYPIQVLIERKFCLRFCTSSIKRELWALYVVVVQ